MSSIMAVARGASRVALLAEGVDRNLLEQGLRHKARVALLAEGVDKSNHCETLLGERSPSSRRAWIEIMRAVSASSWKMVALLAEGVDKIS